MKIFAWHAKINRNSYLLSFNYYLLSKIKQKAALSGSPSLSKNLSTSNNII